MNHGVAEQARGSEEVYNGGEVGSGVRGVCGGGSEGLAAGWRVGSSSLIPPQLSHPRARR